jgi:CubicO group peptidase (beta-lactamase class C family)
MKKIFGVISLSVFITFSIILSSCSGLPALTTEQSIDNILSDYNAQNAPGASVVVMKNDTIIFKKAYGSADLKEQRTVTATTNFRLASVTKEFTAMCILMLQEKGNLSLDDKIFKFFPDFPLYGKDITVRNLLNHTSGLIDYESFVPDSQSYQVLDNDCLELLKKADSLYFQPGTKYQYSNSGYAMLALIVERASGKRYADFVKENVFTKTGMQTSVAFENGISTVPNRAYGYSLMNGVWVQTDQSNTSAVLGDGGIYSNGEEMALWISALWNHKLISPQTQELAWSNAALNDGTPIDYGMGWHIETYKGIRHPHHGGSSRGFRNHILVFPDQKLMVIILTNRNQSDPIVQAHAVADLFLK